MEVKSRRTILALLLLQSLPLGAFAYELELSSKTAKQGESIEVIVRRGKVEVSAAGSGTSKNNADSANALLQAASSSSDATSGSAGGVDAAGGAALPVVQFRDKRYKLFSRLNAKSSDELGRALIGVPADLPPADYKVVCAGEQASLKVLDGHFGVQVMRLPKGKDNFKASPGETEAVDAAKATVTARQYWQDRFLKPSPARVSSAFGLRRRVNGKLLSDYFHSGLDFAGALGSPVLACQSGRVLIAHQGWKLHGNTVCIDHGQGVLSFYIHLSKIFVKEGQIVNAHQKIGAIGSTGRANGPHLHFSLYVNGDATNPAIWFARAF